MDASGNIYFRLSPNKQKIFADGQIACLHRNGVCIHIRTEYVLSIHEEKIVFHWIVAIEKQ